MPDGSRVRVQHPRRRRSSAAATRQSSTVEDVASRTGPSKSRRRRGADTVTGSRRPRRAQPRAVDESTDLVTPLARRHPAACSRSSGRRVVARARARAGRGDPRRGRRDLGRGLDRRVPDPPATTRSGAWPTMNRMLDRLGGAQTRNGDSCRTRPTSCAPRSPRSGSTPRSPAPPRRTTSSTARRHRARRGAAPPADRRRPLCSHGPTSTGLDLPRRRSISTTSSSTRRRGCVRARASSSTRRGLGRAGATATARGSARWSATSATTRTPRAPRQSRSPLRATGGRARVDDDGAGIPPKPNARVFERFVRLDEARDATSAAAGSAWRSWTKSTAPRRHRRRRRVRPEAVPGSRSASLAGRIEFVQRGVRCAGLP